VTLGVEVLDVGADDEVPVLPVFPVEPVSLDEEVPPLEPVLPEPDEVDPDEVPCPDVLLAPGWTWATTIPIAAVAPVAARTIPRVRRRSRDRAISLLWGVFGWLLDDMWLENLSFGTLPSQHPRIETLARPAVGLL
jgi:hypothetical protein